MKRNILKIFLGLSLISAILNAKENHIDKELFEKVTKQNEIRLNKLKKESKEKLLVVFEKETYEDLQNCKKDFGKDYLKICSHLTRDIQIILDFESEEQ